MLFEDPADPITTASAKAAIRNQRPASRARMDPQCPAAQIRAADARRRSAYRERAEACGRDLAALHAVGGKVAVTAIGEVGVVVISSCHKGPVGFAISGPRPVAGPGDIHTGLSLVINSPVLSEADGGVIEALYLRGVALRVGVSRLSRACG